VAEQLCFPGKNPHENLLAAQFRHPKAS